MDMYVKGGYLSGTELMLEDISSKESFNNFAREFGIGLGQNYTSPREQVREFLKGKDIIQMIRDSPSHDSHMWNINERENVIYSLAKFIAAVPLNSYTKDLQKSLLEKLEKGEPTIKDRVRKEKARHLYFLCHESKQRRDIEEFIKKKNTLRKMEIINEKALDVDNELSYFKELILQAPMGYDED
jgi:hypothetical protein